MNKFQYQNHTISFIQIGEGEQLILGFHGFGMNRHAFSDFHYLIKPNQKLVSIDLFAHGNSVPSDFTGIKITEWNELLSAFVKELGHEKFSMLAYSLGGKIVLETINSFPQHVKEVLLLAPDGFKRIRFYEFLSKTKLGLWVYRRVMINPQPFLKFSDFLTRIRLLPSRLNKFVHYHMEDANRRALVYDVYRTYKYFTPKLKKLAENIDQREIPMTMIFGKHDVVIHHSLGKKFSHRIQNKSLIDIHLMDSGHMLIGPDAAKFVEENNLWFSN